MMREVGERRRIEAATAAATEREQRRIADDLHDGLGQEMTAIALQLEVLKSRLASARSPEFLEVAKLVNQVSASTRHARDISHGLSPRIVVERGLLAGLHWLANHTSDLFGLKVTIASNVSEDELRVAVSPELAVTFYRAAQEVINNARRHGHATEVAISIEGRGIHWLIEFNDNGVGLPPLPARSQGMGIKILQHRMSTVGGSSQVGPRADGNPGVRVTLVAPRATATPVTVDSVPETAPHRGMRPQGPWGILLVDDHAIIRDGVAGMIEQTGNFKVVAQAATLKEALLPIPEPPEIAILDLFLDGTSGFDLIPLLLQKYPRIRILVYSMGAQEIYGESARKAGAHGFISKQTKPDDLLTELNRLIER